jgi:hypothetical protein
MPVLGVCNESRQNTTWTGVAAVRHEPYLSNTRPARREQEMHHDGDKYGLADYRLFHRLWL